MDSVYDYPPNLLQKSTKMSRNEILKVAHLEGYIGSRTPGKVYRKSHTWKGISEVAHLEGYIGSRTPGRVYRKSHTWKGISKVEFGRGCSSM